MVIRLDEHVVAKHRIIESDGSKLPNKVLCRVEYPICNVGEKNLNGRVYEQAVWDRVIADPALTEKIKKRALFGQAEHPEFSQSNLEKTSHVVVGMRVADNKVYQSMDVLDTPYGRLVDTLLEADCSVGVSTRAEGDLEEKEDDKGDKYHRVVPESYMYITTDFTAEPSTKDPYPERVEKELVGQIDIGVGEGKVDKKFATSLLERLRCQDAKVLLESLQEDDGKDEDKKGGEDEREDKEGKDAAEGTVEGTDEEEKKGEDTVEKKKEDTVKDEDKEGVGKEEKDGGGTEEVKKEDVAKEKDTGNGSTGTGEAKPDEKEEDEGSGNVVKGTVGEEDDSQAKGDDDQLTFESFDSMVDFLKKRWGEDDEMQKKVSDLISMGEIDKKIKGAQIDEASVRAERDKAIGIIGAERERLQAAISSHELEVHLLSAEVGRIREMSGRRQGTLWRTLEKRVKEINSLKERIEKGERKHRKNLASLEEEYKRKLVKEYITIRLESRKMRIPKSSQALLEKCASVEEAEEILDRIIGSLRESALHSGGLNELQVEVSRDKATEQIVRDVGSAFEGMGKHKR